MRPERLLTSPKARLHALLTDPWYPGLRPIGCAPPSPPELPRRPPSAGAAD
jgi:hypothetical protein